MKMEVVLRKKKGFFITTYKILVHPKFLPIASVIELVLLDCASITLLLHVILTPL